MLNLSMINAMAPELQSPIITEQCVDWCAIQHISFYNNINVWAVLLIALSYILLLMYDTFKEIDLLRKYAPPLVQVAKVFLLIFLFIWVFIIHLRMYWIVGG